MNQYLTEAFFPSRPVCFFLGEPTVVTMQPVKQWSMDYQPGGYRQENGLFLNLSLFRYIVSINRPRVGRLSGKCDYDQRVVCEYVLET